jgi:hypothetical protein
MKPERSSENHESFRRLMREWPVHAPMPPRFQEEVWRRIERAEVTTEAFSWSAMMNWFLGALTRPALAAAYVSALLVLGLFAGYWHALADTTSWDKALAIRYVQAVDPYQQAARN